MATKALIAAVMLFVPTSLAALSGAESNAPATDHAFDNLGYRQERYRAPVTRDPAPALQIALNDALALDPTSEVLFIDVLPVEGGVRDKVSGVWKLAVDHETIPGSVWHPETGRAAPDAVLWNALRMEVAKARRTDPQRRIVLFCRVDCWMGWNAARRLASEGVSEVYWLAEGTEGWHDAGRTLAPVRPIEVTEADPCNRRMKECRQ